MEKEVKLVDRVIDPVLGLPRLVKRLIALGLDAGLCILAVWVAYYLRLGDWVTLAGDELQAVVVSLLVALPIFTTAGLYRAVFRYVNSDALITIAQAVFVYGAIYAAIFTAIGVPNVPRTVGLIQPGVLLLLVSSSRALGRYVLAGEYRERLRRHLKRNVVIYGAGKTGRQLAVAIRDSAQMRVVGFVDDARDLQGTVLNGLRVWPPSRLASLIDTLGVSEIILAMPGTDRPRRNEILSMLRPMVVSVRTLPPILDLAHGKLTVSDLQSLEIDDLLGREPVAPDLALLERTIRGRTVLVTGAGGSIGSELCRQIAAMKPSRLLLVEVSEFALYGIHRELSRYAEGASPIEIVPLLASVCDGARMRRIFDIWRPETIYHAAAYKHVPLVEHNIVEGVRNNVAGTAMCALLAREFQAANFVLVSTDKAVRPTNVMGASKRAAELVLQALAAEEPSTRFAMVRFGNVLGSSGSVVPVFRQQIAEGGPITVTHREVTRYFMTIPEAAQLVLQAGAMAKGGEVFVLDMGEPVRILDLAHRMIELSGLRIRSANDPGGDIEIVISGLRPGEKLYEELLIGDNPTATEHPRIMMASEKFLPIERILAELAALEKMVGGQEAVAVREWLSELIPEYAPAEELVDWTYGQERLENAAE